MTAHVETSITLLNETYAGLISKIDSLDHKSDVSHVKISNTSIFEVKKRILTHFENLTDLVLSNCTIYNFENGIFDKLIHLKLIDLSNNSICLIGNSLFRLNIQLEVVNMRNNILKSTNKLALAMLENLQSLDLSYNQISVLNEDCLNCPNLKTLHLNYNQIKNVAYDAFSQIPNLTYLALDHNEIEYLESVIFKPTINLRTLNLSNNNILELSWEFFIYLSALNSLNLSNNQLTQTINEFTFKYNQNLEHLDMSDNNILSLEKKAFITCRNLKTLNLMISKQFLLETIEVLKPLKIFKLFYNSNKRHILRLRFWTVIVQEHINLTILKLVVRKLYLTKFCSFSPLKNLESFHLESIKTCDHHCIINLEICFDNMPKLREISLIKLNNFTISKFKMVINNVTRFNITGIKNKVYLLSRFTSLKYLNLSFSNIEVINESVFKYLAQLDTLILTHTKITSIPSKCFQFNIKLRFLNCSHCRLQNIAPNAFEKLHNLVVLDLSANCLRNVCPNTFHGLRVGTTILL